MTAAGVDHRRRNEEIGQLVTQMVDERLAELAAAYLPRLQEPTSIRFERHGHAGIWEQCTPQEAVRWIGLGRRARVVMDFEALTMETKL